MSRRTQRVWIWLAMLTSGASLFQAVPFTGTGFAGDFGCQRFATSSVGNSIDFCFLLDCENGFAGGLIDPCADVSVGQPWLLDCPGGTTGGGTNGGTDTTGTTGTTTGTGA